MPRLEELATVECSLIENGVGRADGVLQNEMVPPPDKIRILMLVWEFPPHCEGGLGTACGAIADELGHLCELTVCGPRVESLPTDGFTAVSVLGAGAAESYVTSPNTETVLWKRTQEFRTAVVDWLRVVPSDFDIIYSHDWLTAAAAFSARARLRCRWVVHAHSLEIDRCPDVGAMTPVRALERSMLAQADRVIAVSHWHRTRIVSEAPHCAAKCFVIHHGGREVRDRKTAGGGPLKLVFVGRLTWQKAPERFLDLIQHIASDGKSVEGIVVGNGELLGRLEARANNDGLAIKFLGKLQHCGVQSILSASDVLVLPSRHEPFGLVALEAAANRASVVLTDRCGAIEVLPNALIWSDDLAIADLADQIGKIPRNRRESMRSWSLWADVAGRLVEHFVDVDR